MTGVILIDEGKRLARSCTLLCRHGESGQFAAVWRGPGLVQPPEGRFEHWLSFDCRFLPNGIGPSFGCMSIYTGENRSGTVSHDPGAVLTVPCGGRSLYARPTSSLPPLEAVFLFGSARVQDWLHHIDWRPDWGWNGNFPDPTVASAYIEAQRADLPVDGEEVFAVLGGWNQPWPEGDWLSLINYPLVVLTLAESDPWVEVFNMHGNFTVIQRVT